jgi:hypothetical protein
MLTVIEEVDPVRDEKRQRFIRRVIARCECGCERVFRLQPIISGKYKSCGHLAKDHWRSLHEAQREQGEAKIKSYVGIRLFKWTVLSGYINETHQSIVVVQCECGHIAERRLELLLAGKSRSCGCGRYSKLKEYVSEVDGEVYKVGITGNGYVRVAKRFEDDKRGYLYVIEGKNVYDCVGRGWSTEFHLHHIDNDKANCALSNLAIFSGTGEHHKHHALMEQAMYGFLKGRGLLDEFYEDNPDLKLTTLEEVVEEHRCKERLEPTPSLS